MMMDDQHVGWEMVLMVLRTRSEPAPNSFVELC